MHKEIYLMSYLYIEKVFFLLQLKASDYFRDRNLVIDLNFMGKRIYIRRDEFKYVTYLLSISFLAWLLVTCFIRPVRNTLVGCLVFCQQILNYNAANHYSSTKLVVNCRQGTCNILANYEQNEVCNFIRSSLSHYIMMND